MKPRQEIVDEMLVQVRGVFQHYTDQKLTNDQLSRIRLALELSVPHEYTSETWCAYAAEWDARVRSEAEM